MVEAHKNSGFWQTYRRQLRAHYFLRYCLTGLTERMLLLSCWKAFVHASCLFLVLISKEGSGNVQPEAGRWNRAATDGLRLAVQTVALCFVSVETSAVSEMRKLNLLGWSLLAKAGRGTQGCFLAAVLPVSGSLNCRCLYPSFPVTSYLNEQVPFLAMSLSDSKMRIVILPM